MTFGIRSFIRFGKDFSPLAHLVLYLQKSVYSTHYLNSFRGKPAIYEFGWPFTPYHRSSARFSTQVGSVLHSILLELQPAHGKITRFRVYRT